jgi:hypothetical protein
VFREDLPAPGVDLDLAGDGHPGALEAEVETADAGEQGQDVHRWLNLIAGPHGAPGAGLHAAAPGSLSG